MRDLLRGSGWLRRAAVALGVLAGAALLRILAGVGFANYDTLYALLWGQQLARGQTPEYGVPIAPTPHPLVELLGLVTAPLGPKAMEQIAVWLGFVALSACVWVTYRLGRHWFGMAAGILAGLLLITRGEILSYGVRAYIDVPYLLFVLAAILVESRRPRAGAPVLWLLAVAGLLRPEAWVLAGLYWLYLAIWHWRQGELRAQAPRLAGLAVIGASGAVVWLVSDLLVTGRLTWSLTHTRGTAEALHRKTGLADMPQYIPRRIGEILRPPVLLGAAVGGILSLWWLRDRARVLAIAGILAVLVFVMFAALGLPINVRYAFLAAAILCVFCGVGVFGWRLLAAGDPRRRWWMAAGAVVAIALIVYIPSQYQEVQRHIRELKRYEAYQDEVRSLVRDRVITTTCGPVGVPNHAPVPLLALYLRTRPGTIVNLAEAGAVLTTGTYLAPANALVKREYILVRQDREELSARVPAGFRLAHAEGSWRVYKRCAHPG